MVRTSAGAGAIRQYVNAIPAEIKKYPPVRINQSTCPDRGVEAKAEIDIFN